MFAVTGKYGRPSSFASRLLLNTIGIDSSAPTTAIGIDRHAGAHRDLDEPAAPEAAQLVALGEALAGGLRALGEHEHELPFVVQEPVRVVGMRGDAAAARPQRADHRQRAEQVLGEAVDRAAELCLDAVHDRRRVGRDRARVVRDEQRAAGRGQVVEVLPLDAEAVLVDRVVEPPGQRAEVLAATPRVDVGTAQVGGRVAARAAPRDRDEIAGAVEHLGLGDEIEIRAASRRRRRDARGGRPSREANRNTATAAKQNGCESGCLTPGVQCVAMDRSSTVRFAHAARRLGAAARAAGLTVPAFRSPPRRPGAPRTIRRLPGGPVVAVVLRDRAFADVLADMVEGIVIANRLQDPAAARVRRALLDAVTAPAPRLGSVGRGLTI